MQSSDNPPAESSASLAAAPRGDCACSEEPTAQTPSLPFREGDHLRRARGALGRLALSSHADSRTRSCG